MVKTGCELVAAVMGDVNGTKGANAVGQNGDDDAGGKERNTPWPLVEAQIGDEDTIGDHRNQELDPGTGLGHPEIAGGGCDENPVDMRRNAGPAQKHHAHLRGQSLQCGHRLFANGDEEEHVE